MEATLTLKIDKNVIEKAKIYAAEHKHSLSFMVENYLKSVTSMKKKETNNEIRISNLAKSFTITEEEANLNIDYKKELQEILCKKYGL